jgi:general transcription factor 3C polypeptide 3 (transcription factor C subunit 4)
MHLQASNFYCDVFCPSRQKIKIKNKAHISQVTQCRVLLSHAFLPCAGACLLMTVMAKSQSNRHDATVKAFSFLFKYYHLAGDNAIETNYNLGRAFHHLGLTQFAISYYNKSIELSVQHEEKQMRHAAMADDTDIGGGDAAASPLGYSQGLRREAAFNLSLIYRGSGNLELARQILRDHMTV